jgi:hypothetical protein
MSRSTEPSGTPAFCSRVLEVMSSEPFDLGHGISVKKTCSIGWAAYPWCRGAYEALCAEEAIVLADAALYQAKALGRNQGVGIVPGDGATQNPQSVNLELIREGKPPLARTVRTLCPEPGLSSQSRFDSQDQISKFDSLVD